MQSVAEEDDKLVTCINHAGDRYLDSHGMKSLWKIRCKSVTLTGHR